MVYLFSIKCNKKHLSAAIAHREMGNSPIYTRLSHKFGTTRIFGFMHKQNMFLQIRALQYSSTPSMKPDFYLCPEYSCGKPGECSLDLERHILSVCEC
jgi:hypothetical protein